MMVHMIRLTARDSSRLARVAQYAVLQSNRAKERVVLLLKDVSPDAQQIGKILIGEHVGVENSELREFANELKTRAEKNRKYVQSRLQASKSRTKTRPDAIAAEAVA
jgi:hypothetical protein